MQVGRSSSVGGLTFATLAPHAAASTHAPVEMFTVLAPSPPVPTMSSESLEPGTPTALARMARARPASWGGEAREGGGGR